MNPPSSWFADVKAWDETTGVDAGLELRVRVMKEEWEELQDALALTDQIEIADACADLIWTVLGLANHFGFPFDAIWGEVSRSNWTKVDEQGNVLRRADGKISKPPSFSPPDIAAILSTTEASDGD